MLGAFHSSIDGMHLFEKLVCFNEVIILILLMTILPALFNVSVVSSIQYASGQNFIYGNSALTPEPATYDLGIYNGVYSIIKLEQKDDDSTPVSADTTQSSDPRDSAVITMHRHGTANGASPVYSLSIHGNGSVTYKGIKNVNTSGIQTYQIPKDRAIELVNEFINIYYFALKDNYGDSSTNSNHSMVTTSINMNGKTKTILDDHSSYAPPTLRALEDKIDQVTNSKQWIGLK